MATLEEQKWMAQGKELGCIACIVSGRIAPYSVPSEYTATHHIDGQTKKRAHLLTIPLCPSCHQQAPDSRHQNKTAFIKRYGNEYELLELTKTYLQNHGVGL